MRVAWLAPYPGQLLQPALPLARLVPRFHPCSWIVALSEAMAARADVDLHIFTDSHLVAASQTVRKDNITFHVIRSGVPFIHRRFPSWLPLDALTGFWSLSRRLAWAVRAVQPDVVHAHGTEAAFALAGLRSRCPCLISMQGVVNEIVKIAPSFRSRQLCRTELLAVRHNRFFTCRTDFDSRFVRSVNPQARIFCIHEAMRPEFFANDWRLAATADVLFVGEVVKRKGIEDLLHGLSEAQAVVPNVRLRVIGAGAPDYLAHLRDLSRQLGIADRVDFLGFLCAPEIAHWHLRSQLFVLPSENENSPNSLAEAMVSGLPVIATAVGGIPSLVETGTTGLLVPPNDPRQLAAAMARLLTQPEERQRLGDHAGRVARARHNPQSVAEQTTQAYQEIIRETS